MDEKTIRKHVAVIAEAFDVLDGDGPNVAGMDEKAREAAHKAHGEKVEQLKKDLKVAVTELAAEVVISLVRIANGLSVAQGSPLIERPAGKPGKG
jgi:hypothetical protein